MKRLRWFLILVIFILAACGNDSVEKQTNESKEASGVSVDETTEEVTAEETTEEVSVEGETLEEIEILDNGCYSDEIYIEHEQTCIKEIECTDYESCIEWGNQLISNLEYDYGSLVAEESVATDEEGLEVLVTYDIDLETEEISTLANVTDEELEWHGDLWFSFSWLIPEEYREAFNKFDVFESGNTLAYVVINDDYAEYWTLGMNNQNIELASETLVTYLHEYAHYLSLNDKEVDYFTDETGCNSVYIESGCLFEDAYILDFYMQFWADGSYDEIDSYYVSGYAMTSPEEDFSESFAHFVLTQTPEANTIADEKILWFYQYEEFVQLRTEILSRVATWMVRSVAME
ncbi:hypothetical protein [Ureibacillus manganicus]|uniref:Peptidase M43 pregnancy-associated plasma-A domain-containing protein n=1 Tax=Ureibacillus manganicus DSM 26584 TaxID=1384049 RepID=A0A0A3I3F5_9BACL|nr:hypothetical protein [Ureibacillus manganicus]KGR79311.1 hypothetical protein CD29_06335 [Ureibacillus manganicus DSM 26584]